MSTAATRASRSALVALSLLFLAHNDYWLWHAPRLLFGLPAGFAYHVGFCLVTSLVMALLTRRAWHSDSPSQGS